MVEKICPHCGHNLMITAPSRSLYPWLMGISENAIEFCLKPSMRFFRYTKSQKSDYSISYSMKSFYENNRITRFFGNIEGSRRLTRGVLTVPYIRKCIENDKIFKSGLVFMCGHCNNLVAVNKNPARFSSFVYLYWLGLLWFSLISLGLYIGTVLDNLTWLLILIGASAIITVAYSIFILCEKYKLIKCENNFVPLDQYGNLKQNTSLITISKHNIPNKYLKIGNIFVAKFKDNKTSLYITSVDDDTVDLYICAAKDEQKFILSQFDNLLKNNGVELLSLYFKDLNIATSEVLAIHDFCYQEQTDNDVINAPISSMGWYCHYCGYTNSDTLSECKSCGTYKK